MKEEEALQYINENVLPKRLQVYKLEENELLQYAVSAASITYVQRAKRQLGSRRKNTYQMPEKIRSVADMIVLLMERGILRPLFTRKEVCDMTTAQFSREDILRVSMRESMREDVREEVREELYDEVRKEVCEAIRDEVRDAVRDEVRDEVRNEVRDEVRNEVRDEVRNEVRDEVRNEVCDSVKYDMVLSLYKQGVNDNVIAQAAGITVEELKRWINFAAKV